MFTTKSVQGKKYIRKQEQEINKDFLPKDKHKCEHSIGEEDFFQVIQSCFKKRKRVIQIKIFKKKVKRLSLINQQDIKKEIKTLQTKENERPIFYAKEKIQDDGINLKVVVSKISDGYLQSIFELKKLDINLIYDKICQLIECLLFQMDKGFLHINFKPYNFLFNISKYEFMKVYLVNSHLSNQFSKKVMSEEKSGFYIFEKAQDYFKKAAIELYSNQSNLPCILVINKFNIISVYCTQCKLFNILIFLLDKNNIHKYQLPLKLHQIIQVDGCFLSNESTSKVQMEEKQVLKIVENVYDQAGSLAAIVMELCQSNLVAFFELNKFSVNQAYNHEACQFIRILFLFQGITLNDIKHQKNLLKKSKNNIWIINNYYCSIQLDKFNKFQQLIYLDKQELLKIFSNKASLNNKKINSLKTNEALDKKKPYVIQVNIYLIRYDFVHTLFKNYPGLTKLKKLMDQNLLKPLPNFQSLDQNSLKHVEVPQRQSRQQQKKISAPIKNLTGVQGCQGLQNIFKNYHRTIEQYLNLREKSYILEEYYQQKYYYCPHQSNQFIEPQQNEKNSQIQKKSNNSSRISTSILNEDQFLEQTQYLRPNIQDKYYNGKEEFSEKNREIQKILNYSYQTQASNLKEGEIDEDMNISDQYQFIKFKSLQKNDNSYQQRYFQQPSVLNIESQKKSDLREFSKYLFQQYQEAKVQVQNLQQENSTKSKDEGLKTKLESLIQQFCVIYSNQKEIRNEEKIEKQNQDSGLICDQDNKRYFEKIQIQEKIKLEIEVYLRIKLNLQSQRINISIYRYNIDMYLPIILHRQSMPSSICLPTIGSRVYPLTYQSWFNLQRAFDCLLSRSFFTLLCFA
ncbi:hypothetical protein ABPG72_014031 [Tetrahymena utriculariae]